jgi:cytochrome c oxidase subunit 3
MVIFLVSLGVLFAGSLVAYVVVRWRAAGWPPADLPPLPRVLVLSTALILAGSGTVQWALVSARSGRLLRLRIALTATLALGIAFLASQTAGWVQLVGARATVRSDLYSWMFYFLTGLHALHVIGGLVPLTVVTVNAYYNRYSALYHTAVRFCTMYWHFLGVVWITLYGMLAWR